MADVGDFDFSGCDCPGAPSRNLPPQTPTASDVGDFDFSGCSCLPILVGVSNFNVHDNRTVDITYNLPANTDDAQNPSNYTIDHGLFVVRSLRITDCWFRLTTNRQIQGTTYSISASNIRAK